jgi:hypothetical protein
MNHIKGLMIVIVVLAAELVWAADPVDCVYHPKMGKADRAGSVQEYKNCGTMVERKVVLSKRHLQRLDYDKYELATVFVQGQFYYVKRNGSMLPVVKHDNWADDYAEGLVRSSVDGKIAFYDRGFRQIIAPKYDWAAPFKEGRSLVCVDCKPEVPDEEGHAAITGGLWGYMGKKGEEVTPVKYTREEAEQMQ